MALVKIFISWHLGIGKIILTLKKVKCMKSFLIALVYEVDTKLQSTLVSKQKTKHKNQKIKIWCQHQSKMLDFSIEFRDWFLDLKQFFYSLWIYSILSHCGNARARWRNRCFYASRYVAVVSNVDRVLARIMQGKVSKESGGSTTP